MKKYHYTESGLKNVYLVNGFEIIKTDNNNKEIFIYDIHGLHKAIGTSLIFKKGLLAGDEIKFIRTTLDLSQKSLGKLLGLDYQSILGWEKNKTPISKTADHFLKVIFFSYLYKDDNSVIYDKINEIAAIDSIDPEATHMELQEIDHQWKLAVAC